MRVASVRDAVSDEMRVPRDETRSGAKTREACSGDMRFSRVMRAQSRGATLTLLRIRQACASQATRYGATQMFDWRLHRPSLAS